jgi:sugar (pentulose or hexulose) kinase
MAAIGTGNTQPGVVTASLGTSGTLFAFSTVPIIDPQGEVAAFCDNTDNWLLLICTLNLTLVTEHVRNLFGWDYIQLEEQNRCRPCWVRWPASAPPTLRENARWTCRTAPAFSKDLRSRISPLLIWLAQHSRA